MSQTGWREPTSPSVQQMVEEQGKKLEEGKIFARLHNDERILEEEMRSIFGRCWNYVGHQSEVPNPGDYSVRYIGEDPFIFVRDESNEIQVLYNTCRHQGNRVCRVDQGNTSHFRCTFHGWTYTNSGELVGVNAQERCFKNLDKEEHGLRSAPRVDDYHGMVFASLAEEGQSLEDYLGDFTWYLDLYLRLAKGGMEVIAGPRRWILPANWKTGAETTSADSYHTGTTHQSVIEVGFEGEVDFQQAGLNPRDRHISHIDSGSISHRIEDPEAEEFFGLPKEYVTDEHLTEGQFQVAAGANTAVCTLFPNLSFVQVKATNNPESRRSTYYWNLRQWRPLTPNKTEVWSWDLAPQEFPDELKERSHDASVITLGPTGSVEMDDIGMFTAKTEGAQGQIAIKGKHEWVYQLGIKEMSDHIAVDWDWPGPGTCWDTNLEEGCMRTFYWNWYKAMTGQDVGTTWRDDPQARVFYEDVDELNDT